MLRNLALTFAAATVLVAASLGGSVSAQAQGYGDGHGYGYNNGYNTMPPRVVPPPPHSRARPVDPYYGNAPTYRKYGHGGDRHWRRWVGRPHPAWRQQQQAEQGWARPRYWDHR